MSEIKFEEVISSPFNDGVAVLKHEERIIPYRGMPINYEHYFYKDKKTGEQFTTTEIDNYHISQWIENFNNKYPKL